MKSATTPPLSYERAMRIRPSRIIQRLAHLTLVYPLIVLGALYGEWMLAWAALRHTPRTWMDDPKDVLGGLPHLLTAIVFLGVLPAALAGTVLNVIFVVDSKARAWIGGLRLVLFWMLWLGGFFLLLWDPFTIGKWWLD